MKISIKTTGLLNPEQLRAWTKGKQQQINRAVRRGMYDAKPTVDKMIADHIEKSLDVKKKTFAKSFRGKIFANSPDRLPVMGFGSRAQSILGAHQTGVTISGKAGRGVLIPINVRGARRIGRKQFKRIVERLMSGGNAFFKRVNGKVLLFAEHTAEFSEPLRRYNKTNRLSKSRKSGGEIPIAVFVPQVRLRKRLNLEAVAAKAAGVVAEKVRDRLADLDAAG